MINIVLVEPEIPQNAGNIVRTTAVIGAHLYMVRPLGFEMTEKHFKRAGLDYFDLAHVDVIDSLDQLMADNKDKQWYFASTKSHKTYDQVSYPEGCFIVFGKESYGLKETLLKANYDKCIRIPMIEGARSLNLSNSVAIIAYEAMRQQGFEHLQPFGKLTGRVEK